MGLATAVVVVIVMWVASVVASRTVLALVTVVLVWAASVIWSMLARGDPVHPLVFTPFLAFCSLAAAIAAVPFLCDTSLQD